MKYFGMMGIFLCLTLIWMTPEADAAPLIAGVNIVNPMRASVASRTALIGQLKAAGVKVVRCGLSADAAGMAFAKALYAQGIRIELIVSPKYPAGAPKRAYQPKIFPGMWGGPPLSFADPALSKIYFQKLLQLLDANGVVLAGLELGNEINWSGFKPGIPASRRGQGFRFGRSDS